MESFEFEIEKAAGLIIEKEGIFALTLDALGLLMRIAISRFSPYLKNDEEILQFMALRFKNEIQQLINNIASLNHEPEKELTDLLKGLYDYFNIKSYFFRFNAC